MTTYSDAGAVEVLVHVALPRGGMAQIRQRNLYPQVYPGLIERGLLEVITEKRGQDGELVPQVVRLTSAGKAHAQEVLTASFEDLGSVDCHLCGDLLNLVFLKTRGNTEVPAAFDWAWEALGVGLHHACRIMDELVEHGLLQYPFMQGSDLLWITQPGIWALREYFGVWGQQAEREVRLRSFTYMCEARPVTLRRELGDDRANRLVQLVAEMRSLGEDSRGVAALGREAMELLSGAEGDSVERVRAVLGAPSLVARRKR